MEQLPTTPKRYFLDEVATLAEIENMLHVRGLRAHRATRHAKSFPSHVGKVGNARVYAIKEVEAWYNTLRGKSR